MLGWSAATTAVDALFVAIAGLLAAIVMSISSGASWRREPAPNSALARQLEQEDEAYRRLKARRAELQDLNAVALAHARSARQAASLGSYASTDSAADRQATGSRRAPAPGAQVQVREELPVESGDERRSRLLLERLRLLAKNRPDAVADVIRTWVNQPRPGGY